MENMPGMRVLAVDDVYANALLLKRIVQSFDVEVVIATDGLTALKYLTSEPFDLVLLDIMMPNLNGFEVLHRIREQWDINALPVIMLSALDDVDDMIAGLDAGANDYIVKPFSNQLVKQRVINQLRSKKLTDERQQTLEAIYQADAMKTQLMQVVSHDLKNPLSNLLMMFEMTEPGEPLSVAFSEMAQRSANQMLEIVTSFLDSGLANNGEVALEPVPLDADAAVMDSIEPFQHTAAAKGVTIQMEAQPGTVLADPHRLRQIISNLVSNAVKYTYPNTVVQVLGRVCDESYYIDIIDAGEGIPADEVNRLFQPFSKLSTRPTAGEHSNGLGLWIVQHLVNAQGGEVGVTLDDADGAHFWLRLPLAYKTAPAC